jgi:hypothetical protein
MILSLLLPLVLRRAVAQLAVGAALLLTLASGASATLVLVEYNARNGEGDGFPDNGGPHWVGVVDTDADALTIYSWTELPGTPSFWSPWIPDLTAAPLVWPAVSATGTPYDVPDSFMGQIDSTFGFISPVSAQNMVWKEGEWGESPEFHLSPDSDFYPGWGGVRKPVFVDGSVVMVYDTSANETEMPLLPIDAFGLAKAEGATVTAVVVPNLEGIVAVPESSAFLFGGLAAAVACGCAIWPSAKKFIQVQSRRIRSRPASSQP